MEYSTFSIISAVVGFGVLVFLILEIYLFINEKKRRSIKLPSFQQEKLAKEQLAKGQVIVDKSTAIKKNNLVVASLIFVFLISFTTIAFLVTRNAARSSAESSVKIQKVESKGIMLFNDNWQLLTDQDAEQLVAGETIYIGIEKTRDENVTKARIRVNSDQWSSENETTEYNKDFNVFYITYTIKDSDIGLDIQAELYSQVAGWLTE
ncbi:MAG: hypothetical protein KatS3mg091_846 [Patescibacteria group bacterium]|nr:MAG: hypothetical protein KatS3mg090_0979 [Patescibacteria group bacterium]GIW63734.1 MAG: hypothetical protein KatS3mg091_536 [Patescibacteria group bacterium]GIW64044.1 MAG: hypothetical protein KatS3mg091_846 [Patescibacteria group bacterium]